MKTARLLFVSVLCLGTSGCWLTGNKTAAKVASPPPAPQPVADPQSNPQPLPPLPVATATPDPPPPQPLPVADKPAPDVQPVPVQTAPPPRQTVRRKPSPLPPATPGTPAPSTASATPAPELREIISGAQRRQYESEFSQDVHSADAALKQAGARTLNNEQQATMARIRTFLTQAGAARDNDISTALQLARRAALLGQELLKSMK